MTATITAERPDTAEARALIEELEGELQPLYPSESRHGYSVDKLLAQGVAFFVMRENGFPAGCGGVQLMGTEYAELKRMYVRPQFRGSGLAKRMVDHLTQYARGRGIRLVRLETGIHQHAAIALYERAGFVSVGAFGEYRVDPNSLFYEKRFATIEFETPRLKLRQWRDSDRDPFAALNADPEVMEYFPAPQTRASSDATIDTWQEQLAAQGWSNWAAEVIGSGEFIGFVGLTVPRRVLPFSPCVEIGWRLARPYWSRGFASEAARGVLRVGFERLGLDEIVSFTTLGNLRSRAVMERIGMCNANQDFEHPGVPEGHVLRPHCLYRISRSQWAESSP